jgi:hypothetical protein
MIGPSVSYVAEDFKLSHLRNIHVYVKKCS